MEKKEEQRKIPTFNLDAEAIQRRLGELEMQVVIKDSLVLEKDRQIQALKEEIAKLQQSLDSRNRKASPDTKP